MKYISLYQRNIQDRYIWSQSQRCTKKIYQFSASEKILEWAMCKCSPSQKKLLPTQSFMGIRKRKIVRTNLWTCCPILYYADEEYKTHEVKIRRNMICLIYAEVSNFFQKKSETSFRSCLPNIQYKAAARVAKRKEAQLVYWICI